MAQNEGNYEAAALKAATYRLTSTTIEQLPYIVPRVCYQLVSCRTILSTEKEALSKGDSDTAALIHKLKTRISSLLQDRSPEARWAGTVLAKTAIECGGYAFLQDSLPWVRSLLSSLNKNDPITTKKITLITLARLFFLTRDSQSLVREITTPNLPTFITSSIQLLGTRPQLAQTVFEAFSQLIGRHPTIFRSYTHQLRPVFLQYLAPVKSEVSCSEDTQEAARHLFVQLHECAPKNTAAVEWDVGFQHAITCAHEDLDQVFRSVLEEWESTTGYQPIQHNAQALSLDAARFDKDSLGLSVWAGLYQGSQRVIGLLAILRSYLATPTTFEATIKISAVTDLLRRVLSLVRPASPREWEATGRADSRFERKEREELASILPDLHVEAVRTVHVLIQRFGATSVTIAHSLLVQLAWVFDAEKSDALLRTAVYGAIRDLVCDVGAGLSKASVESLVSILSSCCKDVVANVELTQHQPEQSTNIKINGLAAKVSSHIGQKRATQKSSAIDKAAASLLPALLSNLRADYVPRSLRADMDRAAVLTQHRAALIASVQNPSRDHQSLLPLLARMFPGDNEVRLLLKPRMPVIVQSVQSQVDTEDTYNANGTTDGGYTQERLHQAAYDNAQADFAPSKPTLEHLFPVDYYQGDDGVRNALPSKQTNSTGAGAVSAPNKRPSELDRTVEKNKRPRVESSTSTTFDSHEEGNMRIPDESETVNDPAAVAWPAAAESITSPLLRFDGPGAESKVQSSAEALNLSESAQRGEDSDDEDFEMPQLHFRSASDDEDE